MILFKLRSTVAVLGFTLAIVGTGCTRNSSPLSFESKPDAPKLKLEPEDFQKIDYSKTKIEDVHRGNGEPVTPGSHVLVDFKVYEKSGRVIQSTKTGGPVDFLVGRGRLIKAWDDGLLGMKVGGRRRIIASAKDAYGTQGVGAQVAPDSPLVFEVELLRAW